MYKLTLKRQAIKALRKMPSPPARRIRRELDESAKNPRQTELGCERAEGTSRFQAARREMRVIIERYDDACIIDVLRIAPRGQAYRR